MYNLFQKLGRLMVWGVILFISLILLLAFIDLGYQTYVKITEPPFLVVDSGCIIELFSLCLIIIIGLELIETVKAFLKEDVVHVELVILVAIIAIARKVIVWDFEKYSYLDLLSIAGILLALSASYFLVKKTIRRNGSGPKKNDIEQESSGKSDIEPKKL